MNRYKFVLFLCFYLIACKNEAPLDTTPKDEIAPSVNRVEKVQETIEPKALEKEIQTSEGMDTITVSNVEDLVENAKSNRVIYLSKGIYELEPDFVYSMTKEERKIIDKRVVETKSIGGQLFFSGIDDFQIIGQKGAEIVSNNPQAVPFFVIRGKNWKVSNLTIRKPDGGLADLSYFANCQNVEVDRCNFTGGGTYGMYVSMVENMKIKNCTVTKCTSGALRINDSRSITFVNTTFSNNICTVPVVNFYGTGSNVSFNNVSIIDNKKDLTSNFQNSDRIFAAGNNYVRLNNCEIRNNQGFIYLGLNQNSLVKTQVEGLKIQ